jgi:hypothetical protein
MELLRLALPVACAALLACSASPDDDSATDATSGPSATSGNGGEAGSGSGEGGSIIGSGGAGGFGPCGEPTCSGDLHSVVDCNGNVVTECPDDQGCAPGGVCIPACDAAVASESTVGCEYYTQMLGYGCFAAIIANTWSSPVTVNLEAGGATYDAAAFARIPSGNGQAITYAPLPNGQIPPNEVAIVFLSQGCPGGVAPPSTTAAFHITTSAPVVAYDIDPYGGGPSAVTSATLLIPTSAWGTNYIAVAPWPFGPNSQNPRLTLTAAEDATDVTISPVVDMLGGTLDGTAVPGTAAGVPVTYSMNKGQTLRFEQEAELTGSAIASTKPIGMVGSSGCINIDECCCDGAHQQIPPIKALGNEYVGVRYRNRVDGMEESPPWRVIGVVDGTTLTYQPAAPPGAPTTLSLGQVVEFRASGPFVIESQDEDHPFYLAAYMTGGGGFGDAGDPEFVNVIPALQFLPNYVFFADPTYPETNLVVVRRRAGDGMFKDVTLDCAGVLGGWEPIGATDYEMTRFDLVRFDFAPQGNCDNGRREMKSDAPFGLTVWGWGTSAAQFTSTYVSYAYPAGAGVQPINQVVVPPVPK